MGHHLAAHSLVPLRSGLALLVAPQVRVWVPVWVDVPAVLQVYRRREELEVQLQAGKDKYPQVEATRMAHHTQYFGVITISPVNLFKAQAMVTAPTGEPFPANGACLAPATASAVATAVLTHPVSASAPQTLATVKYQRVPAKRQLAFQGLGEALVVQVPAHACKAKSNASDVLMTPVQRQSLLRLL